MALIVACTSSLGIDASDQTWGFLTIDAKQSGAQYVTSPQAMFFKGHLSLVPNASLVLDSCNDGLYLGGGNNLSGVTYLDAGTPVTMKIGARLDTLLRNVSSTATTYDESSVSYTPGDSVVLTVPGAIGGFPAGTIRAKTAEPFSIDPIVVPTGTDAIQLHWTPGQDQRSAIILELRYSPSGATGTTPTREVVCSYTDDGTDSIPFRQHQPWSVSTATNRQVVATRLRTNFASVSNGILEVISTFQVTPP
jgi:hypothetical protein